MANGMATGNRDAKADIQSIKDEISAIQHSNYEAEIAQRRSRQRHPSNTNYAQAAGDSRAAQDWAEVVADMATENTQALEAAALARAQAVEATGMALPDTLASALSNSLSEAIPKAVTALTEALSVAVQSAVIAIGEALAQALAEARAQAKYEAAAMADIPQASYDNE